MISRRTLALSALALMEASLPLPDIFAVNASADAPAIKIGLQLYTLRQLAKVNLRKTLSAVASIGYESVELPGFLGFPPRLLLDEIRAAGLRCDTCHVWPNPDQGDPDLEEEVGRTADLLRSLGLSSVVMPFIRVPRRLAPRGRDETFTFFLRRIIDRLTIEDWIENAEWMNTRAAAFRRQGIAFGYHNHNLEFAPVADSATGMDLLLANTDPALVSFELDAGWCAAAGFDPATLLSRHPGRFVMMHVKNIARATPVNYVGVQVSAPLDMGVIDWHRLLPMAVASGVRRLYVEQETLRVPPGIGDVARSFRYLTSLRSRGA